jgi:orotidine-5'-phosphate decarboxylase
MRWTIGIAATGYKFLTEYPIRGYLLLMPAKLSVQSYKLADSDLIARRVAVLFRDRLCLAVDGSNFERVQRIARDFRGCTTTVKIGPTLLLSWGPYAIRGLSELGMHDIILDMRLFGHHNDIWTAVVESAKTPGVKGIVVQPTCGSDVLKTAVAAAEKSVALSNRPAPPWILAACLPSIVTMSALHEMLVCAATRHEYLCNLARICQNVGLSGMFVEYEDLGPVRAVCDLPLITNVRRKVESYEIVQSPEDKRQPGVCEVLDAGAMHAVLGMELVGHDAEWSADMVAKDLIRSKRRRRS